jgi:hypothetical protein
MMSSRRAARAQWERASKLSKRLAARESDVVKAAARHDVAADPLDPDALRAFVVQRIAAEYGTWQEGDPTSITSLFGEPFAGLEGRYRIFAPHDPLVRLVWAARHAAGEPWRAVVVVWLELVAVGRSWRVYKEYSVKSAYWTLVAEGGAEGEAGADGEAGAEGEGWRVVHVESDIEGQHYLTDPLPEEGSDQQLHDEATISTAVDSAPSADMSVTELTDVDASTKGQLLDLSLVDGRYAPDVIAACACEIARAWESATFARDRKQLEPWCTPEAAGQLFAPAPHRVRRVLDVETRRVQITGLDRDSDPPTVSVTVELHGRRWLADDWGITISGSNRRHRDFAEQWTLRLDPSMQCPWRLIDVLDPGRR